VLSNARTFATMTDLQMGPDGITIDPAGNVYASVRATVRAWNPAGQVVMNLSVPQSSTNLEFGGPTGKTLFITAGTAVYGIDLNIVPEPGVGIMTGLIAIASTRNLRPRVRRK
jgi:gluconolactonase